MKTNELLANIRVASPCSARWGHMIGDDRARFCAQCQKNVYNLSNMTAEEAAALIRSKEGKLCARFYQRADGMVLTSDCPLGVGQVWLRVRRLIGAAAALAVVSVSIPLFAHSPERKELPRVRNKLSLLWDETVWGVKGWFGIQRPRMIMGDICLPPQSVKPPAQPPPPASTPQ